MLASYFTTSDELWRSLGTQHAPAVLDVRRRDVYDSAAGLLPAVSWRDHSQVAQWSAQLDRHRPVVVACKAGHELSQSVAARLRSDGVNARVLQGGYAAWTEAGLPLVAKSALDRLAPQRPSLWVTRRRPKIDRIACPWLIRRFLDPDATILFVEPADVPTVTKETGAMAFDIKDIELSHDGERCTFDTMLKLFGLEDESSLARLALIVRGADTARPDIAQEAAGLHAISLGLSVLAGDDDHGLLRQGFIIYDALFAWLRFAVDERHNWPAKTN